MSTFIFENPPFLSCHASTLAYEPKDDSFVAAWFAGTREGFSDTAIWWSRSQNGAWLRPSIAAKVADVAHWNPVLFRDDKGKLRLFFKVGRWTDSWDTWHCRLTSKGWTKPTRLKSTEGVFGRITQGPVRGKIIRTSSGTFLAPTSTEKYASEHKSPQNIIWESYVQRSTDGGKHWVTSAIPFPREPGQLGGIIQPSLWDRGTGCVSAMIRSTSGRLWRSESYDDGYTWSMARETDILNPNSAVDVTKIDTNSGKMLVLAHNPSGNNWGKRTPLRVSFSDLDGNVFCDHVDIEDNPLQNFSYPFMIEVPGGVAMTYSWRRRNIAFVRMNIETMPVVAQVSGPPIVKATAAEAPKTYYYL